MIVGKFPLQPDTPRKTPITYQQSDPEERERNPLTKVSNSIVLMIRRQQQPRQRNRRIQHHPRHPQPRPIRKPRHSQRPNHAKQIRRRTKQENHRSAIPQRGKNNLNKVRKRINRRAAAQEHEAVHPQLPAHRVRDDLAHGELVGLGVAAVALDAVEDGLELGLGEG